MHRTVGARHLQAGGWDVDFVVVGLGLGALGVLLGVVMLAWLAPRAQRAARTAAADDAAYEQAVAAKHQGTGQAFIYAGAAILLATTGGLAGALDDRTGALLISTTATVAAISILLAGYLHRARNPMPRRRGPVPGAESALVAAGPTVNVPLIFADATTAQSEGSQMSPIDNGEARFDPITAPGVVLESSMPEDTMPIARANGVLASGDVAPDRVGDAPVAAVPGHESGPIRDLPDGLGDDAAPAEEEEVVVVGYVVPVSGSAASPSPPSPRDAGDDPS